MPPASNRAGLYQIIGARSPIHIELGRLKSMTNTIVLLLSSIVTVIIPYFRQFYCTLPVFVASCHQSSYKITTLPLVKLNVYLLFFVAQSVIEGVRLVSELVVGL